MESNIVLKKSVAGISGNKNFLPYYTNTAWSPNEEFFIFFSESLSSGEVLLCAFFPKDMRTEVLCPVELELSSDPEEHEKDLINSVFLPDSGLLLFPSKNRACQMDISSGKTDILFESPQGSFTGGPLCASPDEKFICGGFYYNPRRSSNDVFVWSMADSAFVYKNHSEIYANHFQFFADCENILFAHEGKAEDTPDRLNILNWRTGESRCVYQQEHDASGKLIEFVGHERVAGSKIAAVRYPISEIDFGLILVDPETGSAEMLMQDDCWHCSTNTNANRFVADTMWWGRASRREENLSDILLYDAKTNKKYILCTVTPNPTRQVYHPHPQLNAAGDKVLISGGPAPGSDASDIIFMQLRKG